MKFLQQKHSRGFSLVEILVVLGLFSSIATLSLGSLFNAQAVNRRLQETQTILDNINLSTQSITRDIRFGTIFYATTSIPVGDERPTTKRRDCAIEGSVNCTVLIFRPADTEHDNDRVVYYLRDGTLYKTLYLEGQASSTEQMTSDDVIISQMFFYVEGAQSSTGTNDDNDALDFEQPIITFFLSGYTKSFSKVMASTTFNFETAISPRELDSI